MSNPYQSPPPVKPTQNPPQSPSGDPNVAPCPRCHGRNARKAGFTWWGGALGPRMLSHVMCLNCGAEYNSKTGQSNATGIAIYTIVSVIIGLILGAIFIYWTWTR